MLIPAVADEDQAVWRIVGEAPAARGRPWVALAIFCTGLALSLACALAVWQQARPDTIVETRILADGASDVAGRAALSDLALRLPVAATLDGGGEALVLSAQDRDAGQALKRARAMVDAVLNAPVPTVSAALTPPDSAGTDAAGLRAERARLASAADAIAARSTALSTSLTQVTRDIAAGSRAAPERAPGHETLDKGNAALADLQLQRLQLASKYQDTYPAVLALDGQIRNLRVFLADEARRIEPRTPAVDPGAAALAGERDRVQAEMARLDDQRRAVSAELARTDRALASLPPTRAIALAPPPPVLVSAATTSFAEADPRLVIVPGVAVVGLLLSALAAWFARPRRPKAYPYGITLHPVADPALAGMGRRALGAAMPVALPQQAPSLGAWRGHP